MNKTKERRDLVEYKGNVKEKFLVIFQNEMSHHLSLFLCLLGLVLCLAETIGKGSFS